jgi:hypothetical protein
MRKQHMASGWGARRAKSFNSPPNFHAAISAQFSTRQNPNRSRKQLVSLQTVHFSAEFIAKGLHIGPCRFKMMRKI